MQTAAALRDSHRQARPDDDRAGWLHLCNGLDPTRDGGMVPSILGFTAALAQTSRQKVTLVAHTPTRRDLVASDFRVSHFDSEARLERWIERAELVHMHGLWQKQTRAGAPAARRARTPYLIAAHGMADPWALRHKKWKKRLYRLAVEDRNLKYASCLHALAQPEVDALRRVAPRTPIALVPNGVDPSPFDSLPARSCLFDTAPHLAGRFCLLFFGRLHAKKGLDILAEALIRLARDYPTLHLLLAGRDDGARGPFLRRMQESGLSDRVSDLGHVAGESARHVWAAADAFVLPSYSEGFSMAVLEAMAARRPVVASTACNFPELNTHDAGVVIEPTAESLITGLRSLLERTPDERAALGLRGRALVEQRYTWQKMGEQLADVYRWILAGGAPPEVLAP